MSAIGTIKKSYIHVFVLLSAYVSIGFLLFPLTIVFPCSLSKRSVLSFPIEGITLNNYINLFEDPQWRNPLFLSVGLAISVGFVSTLIGFFSAYGTCYLPRRKRSSIMVIHFLPAFIPPIVVGLAQLLTFGGIGVVDTPLLVLLSHSLLGLPIAYMISLWGLRTQGLFHHQSALRLGASRWYALLRVTIPSLRAVLLGSIALCGLLSFDESVVVLYIADWKSRTLPREMFDSLRYDLSPVVAAAAVLTMCIWTVLCIVLMRKRQLT